MRVFNIHKPKNLHTQQIKKAKRIKYGSENYNGHIDFKFEYSADEEKEICNRYLNGENIWAINRDLHTHKVKSILLKYNIPLRDESENNKIKAEKIKQTNLSRYGVENSAKNKKIIKKIKNTWHSKSETDFLEIKNKSWKKYTISDIYFDSFPELAFYLYNKEELHNNIIRSKKRLEYEFEGEKHFYLPDFEIDGRLIEIKGDQLYEQMLIPNTLDAAKYACMKANNVKIIRTSEYAWYEDWFRSKGYKKENYLYK